MLNFSFCQWSYWFFNSFLQSFVLFSIHKNLLNDQLGISTQAQETIVSTPGVRGTAPPVSITRWSTYRDNVPRMGTSWKSALRKMWSIRCQSTKVAPPKQIVLCAVVMRLMVQQNSPAQGSKGIIDFRSVHFMQLNFAFIAGHRKGSHFTALQRIMHWYIGLNEYY